MKEGLKIADIEVNSVKRIDLINISPNGENVIIGGENSEGKTSLLTAIEWALRGKKYQPSGLANTESMAKPETTITLTDGTKIIRKENSLKIVDEHGKKKGGQKLLDEIFSSFAITLPEFMSASSKEKCKIMLDSLGDNLADEIDRIDQIVDTNFQARRDVNRDVKRIQGTLDTLVCYKDAPADLLDPAELISKQQKILSHNAEIESRARNLQVQKTGLYNQKVEIERLEADLINKKELYKRNTDLYNQSVASHNESKPLDTAEIQKQLEDFELINDRVRANKKRLLVEMELDECQIKSDEYTEIIEDARNEKIKLLESVNMPLPNMTVENGELLLKGQKWDCMSTSEQYIAAVSIVQRLKPEHRFVLLDRLEAMDDASLKEFLSWCESVDLQVIATRVSTGSECNVIIKAGRVLKSAFNKVKETILPKAEDNWEF